MQQIVSEHNGEIHWFGFRKEREKALIVLREYSVDFGAEMAAEVLNGFGDDLVLCPLRKTTSPQRASKR
jgi:hypothetical protein